MKISFFVRTNKETLDIVEFYKQDIDILAQLSDELNIATRIKDIDWNSDIIFIWWWTHAFVPVIIGKLLNKKILITGTFNFHAPGYLKEYKKRNILHRMMIKIATVLADYNILVSMYERNLMLKEWKLQNLKYSPHCVDIDKYKPNGQDRKHFIFTLAGMTTERIINRKCILEIVEAMKILNDRNINFQLIIAGREGVATELVRKEIRDKGLSDRVKLVGEIEEEEKIKYYQQCIMYLQPSRFEGFGLAIAEAMSCGCPVISTDVGAVKEVVNKCGVLLNGCSSLEIANAVEELLTDEKARNRLSFNAQNRIKNNFPLDRRKTELNKIIQSLY